VLGWRRCGGSVHLLSVFIAPRARDGLFGSSVFVGPRCCLANHFVFSPSIYAQASLATCVAWDKSVARDRNVWRKRDIWHGVFNRDGKYSFYLSRHDRRKSTNSSGNQPPMLSTALWPRGGSAGPNAIYACSQRSHGGHYVRSKLVSTVTTDRYGYAVREKQLGENPRLPSTCLVSKGLSNGNVETWSDSSKNCLLPERKGVTTVWTSVCSSPHCSSGRTGYVATRLLLVLLCLWHPYDSTYCCTSLVPDGQIGRLSTNVEIHFATSCRCRVLTKGSTSATVEMAGSVLPFSFAYGITSLPFKPKSVASTPPAPAPLQPL